MRHQLKPKPEKTQIKKRIYILKARGETISVPNLRQPKKIISKELEMKISTNGEC